MYYSHKKILTEPFRHRVQFLFNYYNNIISLNILITYLTHRKTSSHLFSHQNILIVLYTLVHFQPFHHTKSHCFHQ